MGLLDTLLGRSKPVAANLDALFALPSAVITLESTAGLTLSGRAGVCWKPPAGQAVEDVQHEIEQLLEINDAPQGAEPSEQHGAGPSEQPGDEPSRPSGAGGDSGPAHAGGSPARVGELAQRVDAYGYRWLLLEDTATDDLVARVHLINTTLAEAGWGPQLLCTVFGLTPTPDAAPESRAMYLVYLYKRGTFYPFAPTGNEHRDNELELRIRSVLGSDLPVEPDLSRWFPLWDLPFRA